MGTFVYKLKGLAKICAFTIPILSGCATIDKFKVTDINCGKKSYALVVDDNRSTRKNVRKYLEKRWMNVIEAPTLVHAKGYIRQCNIEMVVSDMDLSHTSGFLHKLDGYKFMKWLHKRQTKGKNSDLKNVILHSTVFNKGDFWGSVFENYLDEVKKDVERMGFIVQPKTVILGKK